MGSIKIGCVGIVVVVLLLVVALTEVLSFCLAFGLLNPTPKPANVNISIVTISLALKDVSALTAAPVVFSGLSIRVA